MTSTIKPLTYGEDAYNDGSGSEMYIAEVDDPITQVVYVLNYGDFNKTLALAQLFSIAPELLDALEKAVNRQGFTNDELIDARKLIKKAREVKND